jgi:hypothetical protein
MTQTDKAPAETIVAAAIRVPIPEQYEDQRFNGAPVYPRYITMTAPPPARHHSLLASAFTLVGHGTGPEDQGFITSTGRFVGREEGLSIALASGQPMIDHPSRHDRLLFSEDLW